jgi:glycosyltransferase involved in cell wall biosynthesis
MRILLINNHHNIIGGGERYYFDLAELLIKNGHQVAFFSTQDKKNYKTPFSKYFIKKLNFKKRSFKNSLEKFPKIFFNYEARRNISKLLDDFTPDLVHFQNTYYYISSSIISPIKKRGIPIVQTVHDFQPISTNVVMYHDGKICEIGKKNKYYKAVLHRCVKGSYMASLMAATTIWFQNLGNFYHNSIYKFITPSGFMLKKMKEYGFSSVKLIKIQNFLNKDFHRIKPHKVVGRYVLFFGRLCDAKGLYLTIRTAALLPDIPFKLMGSFEDSRTESEAMQLIKTLNVKNIKFQKFTEGQKLKKIIHDSAFTIIPSMWYENQPYSVMESFAFGKPVVASNLGGIPEMVINGRNGFLFKPGNEKDFAQKINKLWKNVNLIKKTGENAKTYSLRHFSAEAHYKSILNIYKSVLQK